MNKAQEMWWRQAASDYAVFVLLRSQGVASCHPLHYSTNHRAAWATLRFVDYDADSQS